MEPSLQRRIQRYGWDRAARYYEAYWQKQLKPAQDLLMEMGEPRSGERVLDVACGTGLVSFWARQKTGDTGFVLGTDISDKMLEMASIIAKSQNISQIAFERMDAEALDVDDASFDLVLCALGLMYMPDPLKALQEMKRALKPGGHAVAAVWGQREHCGWAGIFEIVHKRVSSEVCPMFFNLGNPGMLEMIFKAADFNRISSACISTTLQYDSAEEACGAALAGGPVALAYHRFSDAVKKEAESDYLDSIRKYKKGMRYEIPGEFIVAIGYK